MSTKLGSIKQKRRPTFLANHHKGATRAKKAPFQQIVAQPNPRSITPSLTYLAFIIKDR